jgi:hypothetical protein
VSCVRNVSGTDWQLSEEHLFALTQAVELYDVYRTKVLICDVQIEAKLKRLKKNAAPLKSKLPPAPRRARQSNETYARHFMRSSGWI